MLNSKADPSNNQFDVLSDLLDTHAAFDIDGVLGLMYAVAVAPAVVSPSTWLSLILSNPSPSLDANTAGDLLNLLVRLYNDVVDHLDDEVATPNPNDVAGCESFAAGFVAGAEVVPEWIARDERWALVMPFAYLAGRLELFPPEAIAEIEHELEPDPKQALRDELADLVFDTHDAFEKYRREPAAPPVHADHPQIGRNDPCSCGSGKKYKRCCAARTASS